MPSLIKKRDIRPKARLKSSGKELPPLVIGLERAAAVRRAARIARSEAADKIGIMRVENLREDVFGNPMSSTAPSQIVVASRSFDLDRPPFPDLSKARKRAEELKSKGFATAIRVFGPNTEVAVYKFKEGKTGGRVSRLLKLKVN